MKFRRIPWNPLVREILSPECGNDIGIIEEEVCRGVSSLWEVTHDDEGNSYFITRPEGRELVIVAYSGQELVETSAIIWNAAKSKGFTSIRAHTKRLAMLRMLRELNPQIVEYVARFFLNEDSDHATILAISQESENSEQRDSTQQSGGFSRDGPTKRTAIH